MIQSYRVVGYTGSSSSGDVSMIQSYRVYWVRQFRGCFYNTIIQGTLGQTAQGMLIVGSSGDASMIQSYRVHWVRQFRGCFYDTIIQGALSQTVQGMFLQYNHTGALSQTVQGMLLWYNHTGYTESGSLGDVSTIQLYRVHWVRQSRGCFYNTIIQGTLSQTVQGMLLWYNHTGCTGSDSSGDASTIINISWHRSINILYCMNKKFKCEPLKVSRK